MGSMTGMTPHTVTRVRPVVTITASGEDRLNYNLGSGSGDASGVSVNGLLQLRAVGGRRLKEGFDSLNDGVFYTDSSGSILPNDMLMVSGQVVTVNYIVIQASEKADLDGNYDHTECLLREADYGTDD